MEAGGRMRMEAAVSMETVATAIEAHERPLAQGCAQLHAAPWRSRPDVGDGRAGRALSGYVARPHALQTGAEMFISSSVRAQKSAFYAGF